MFFVYVEGLISKKAIIRWLENYDSLENGDPFIDAIPTNGGVKASDGVSGTRINKIMLDGAIARLAPQLWYVVNLRWITRRTLRESLKITGIPKSTYYRRCDTAIESLYLFINGRAAGVKALLEKLEEKERE